LRRSIGGVEDVEDVDAVDEALENCALEAVLGYKSRPAKLLHSCLGSLADEGDQKDSTSAGGEVG
jgi:hypothetical protein